MVLECVMIIIDNSVFARNGDIIPNRLQAQLDAVSAIINFKTNDNVETSVGMMTMSGKNCKILNTPTNDTSLLYSTYNKIEIEGKNNFGNALQIAQLAMTHRTNKKQHERVIVFLASELKESDELLGQIARNYRRNKTDLDIINLGVVENEKKIENLMEIVNVDDNSKYVNFEPGMNLLVDALKNSQILNNVGVGGNIQGDEIMDEQLQMALRLSMEEEQKRQAQLDKQKNDMEVEGEQDQDKEKKEDQETQQIKDAEKLVIEEQAQDQNNEFLNDPEFIKEIIGDLNIEDPEKALKEVMKKQEDKKDKEEEEEKKDK